MTFFRRTRINEVKTENKYSVALESGDGFVSLEGGEDPGREYPVDHGVVLFLDSITHASTIDEVRAHILYSVAFAEDYTHKHTVESPIVASDQANAEDISHGHTVDKPAVQSLTYITAAEISHGHTAAEPALILYVAPLSITHGHTADEPTLIYIPKIAAEDATHGHTADGPALILYALASDATHVQAANCVVVSTPGTDYADLASCMGAWYMNDNSTTETDVSGSGSTLTVSSGDTIERLSASLPSGFSGYYRHFEKADEDWMYDADGGATDINGASATMTFFTRFKLESETGTLQRFLFKSLQFSCHLLSDGTINGLMYNNGGSFATAIGATDLAPKVGDWVTIAMVYNDTDIRIYVDGVLDTNGASNPKTFTGGIQNAAGLFFLGCDDTTNQSVDGDIYEAGIWDTALTATQILEMHDRGIAGTEPSIISCVSAEDASHGSTAGEPVISIGVPPATDYVALNSCMGAWYMNEESTTEADRSGSSSDLTVSSGDTIERSNANLPSGFSGYYRHFEQTDADYMTLADGGATDISGATQDMSFFTRFKIESDTSNLQALTAKWGQYIIYIDSTGYTKATIYKYSAGSTTCTGSTDVLSDTTNWQTIGVVVNGTDIRIYVNGLLDSNGASNPAAHTDGIYDSLINFFISSDGSTQFDGDIYESGIWDEALSAANMLEMHNNGIKGDKGASE